MALSLTLASALRSAGLPPERAQFFDALAENLRDEKRAAGIVLDLARKMLEG